MGTIINDSIHGTIQLHPLCVKIIDTPQFQRLRHLKQLGTTYYVYPGASHNRFEHSIGVCYLAGKFVEILAAKQKDLKIQENDILCVKIAGLCHDLGHGPFSHVFETIVKEIRVRSENKWTHEQASSQMLDHLIKVNDIKYKDYNLRSELKDIAFIKRLIHQDKDEDAGTREKETGRGPDKDFLYQIVANEINGLDVDKWDYFARDCLMLGIKNNFDHQRSMQLARVYDVTKKNEKSKQICFRDKEEFNLREMFHTRYTLYKRAYKHKTSIIIDAMILDALKAANDHYRQFVGSNYESDCKLLTMSESVDDMVAYTNLTDDVLYDIGRSTEKELQKARDIINRIARRDLYKCIARKTVTVKTTKKDVEDALLGALKTDLKDEDAQKVAFRLKKNYIIKVKTIEKDVDDTLLDALLNDLKNEDAVNDEDARKVFSLLKKKYIIKVKMTEKGVKDALLNALKDENNPRKLEDDYTIKVTKLDYSKGNEDPIDYVNFFDKDEKLITERNRGGRMQPICEWDILVIYKGSNIEDKKKIKEAFAKCSQEWN